MRPALEQEKRSQSTVLQVMEVSVVMNEEVMIIIGATRVTEMVGSRGEMAVTAAAAGDHLVVTPREVAMDIQINAGSLNDTTGVVVWIGTTIDVVALDIRRDGRGRCLGHDGGRDRLQAPIAAIIAMIDATTAATTGMMEDRTLALALALVHVAAVATVRETVMVRDGQM